MNHYVYAETFTLLKTFSKTFSDKSYHEHRFLPNVERARKKSYEEEMIRVPTINLFCGKI
ncbi:hypothetical protein [Fervidobacterium pennivorans]|jgi:hypothetical protein|uniref:hypothetical protein n=1 Tax=Fervidobacterium pennivorans TaxID=93466 RepID=UPI00031B6A68|nr:hypothetical protein [Fervidobacterium pennivorans]QIV77672.1 hypothetical protein HER11_00730 [Fervidobacterium pennivorans subsp. keratinolyticus]